MNENWVDVAKADDVPEDGTLPVAVEGEPVCLYKLGGTIYATHDVCTHADATLSDGFIVGENIECPLHQGLFHIPSGKAVGEPATEDLRVYPVKIVGGRVCVLACGAQTKA